MYTYMRLRVGTERWPGKCAIWGCSRLWAFRTHLEHSLYSMLSWVTSIGLLLQRRPRPLAEPSRDGPLWRIRPSGVDCEAMVAYEDPPKSGQVFGAV